MSSYPPHQQPSGIPPQPGYGPSGVQPQPGYGQPPGIPPPGAPGWPPPPGELQTPVRRRSGCRGCFITCLVLLVGCAALAVVVVAAGVYLVRQSAPSATTIEQSVVCAILRGAIMVGDQAIEQGDGTEAQKAELRRNLQDLRAQFQRECGPLP